MRQQSERTVEIVDVGPRDGFQPIGPFIPTAEKIHFVERLLAAGVRRIEIGSFVSAKAVPQLSDAAALVAASAAMTGIDPQVLVPTERWGLAAVEAGARHIAFVVSVSEAHNRSNVRRDPLESAQEYAALVAKVKPSTPIRLNLATAFDCPFDGTVPEAKTEALLEVLIPLRPDAEVALCDTTGRASPAHVASLFSRCRRRFPQVRGWAFHAHDTYGLGTTNTLVAYQQGVRVFDAAIGGLGGCPFAPGATGNVATEDVVWMFETMGIPTGIDLAALIPVARDAAALPGAAAGGRVRVALSARDERCYPPSD